MKRLTLCTLIIMLSMCLAGCPGGGGGGADGFASIGGGDSEDTIIAYYDPGSGGSSGGSSGEEGSQNPEPTSLALLGLGLFGLLGSRLKRKRK